MKNLFDDFLILRFYACTKTGILNLCLIIIQPFFISVLIRTSWAMILILHNFQLLFNKQRSLDRATRTLGTKCYLGVFLGKKIYNSTPLYNHETRYRRMSERYCCFVEFGCEKLVFKIFFRVNLVSYRHGFEEKSLSSRLASVSKKAFLKNFIHFLKQGMTSILETNLKFAKINIYACDFARSYDCVVNA